MIIVFILVYDENDDNDNEWMNEFNQTMNLYSCLNLATLDNDSFSCRFNERV
jgi:hypothetical protein